LSKKGKKIRLLLTNYWICKGPFSDWSTREHRWFVYSLSFSVTFTKKPNLFCFFAIHSKNFNLSHLDVHVNLGCYRLCVKTSKFTKWGWGRFHIRGFNIKDVFCSALFHILKVLYILEWMLTLTITIFQRWVDLK
jgi:hypothetical protein